MLASIGEWRRFGNTKLARHMSVTLEFGCDQINILAIILDNVEMLFQLALLALLEL